MQDRDAASAAEVLSMLMLLTRYALHGMLLAHAAHLLSMAGEDNTRWTAAAVHKQQMQLIR